MKTSSSIRRQLLLLALGLLVFAGGVTLARSWLPEWHTGRLPGKRFYVDRYRELARRAGASTAPGEPRVSFATAPEKETGARAARRLDGLSPGAAADLGAGLLVQAKQPASLSGIAGQTNELIVNFTPAGVPWSLRWGGDEEAVRTTTQRQDAFPAVRRADLARLLLRPGERLGQEVAGSGAGGMISSYPLIGSRPPQQISIVAPPGGTIRLGRELGAEPQGVSVRNPELAEVLLVIVPLVAGALTVILLFLVLLGKRRIDFVNGLWIAALLLVAAAIPTLLATPDWTGALAVLGAAFIALWAFLVWSVGESYLRAVQPGLTVSLDALRAGRLGPLGGQSLAEGVAAGALLAGFRLAALATASRLPGVWPQGSSLRFPLFGVMTPFNDAVLLAAGVAIFLGLAHRFLPPRRAPLAAALAGGLAIVPFAALHPPGWQVLVDVAAVGLLVFVGRRAGLAAILAAALCACLLPAAAFSAFHLSWLPVSFVVTAGVPLLLLTAGLAGLRRPEWAERERLPQPAFVRRLEDERRLRYEMDLLARMQRELLPEVPAVEGWEIAVRSLLATEAGGDLYDFLRDPEGNLWIAAGDVAGHGYSCAIVQAMTAAALTSTITATRTPSEVLREVDRVIRRGGSHRNFTSLALVRLDPATGRALLGNAGHPFPLLLAHDGEVEEIDLPGLPLGQGPNRRYADLPFEVPPGGALVFCSDGLFEGADARENAYGYDRPRELLRALGDRSAAEILEALFTDWRKHLGSEGPPADDTTVLVVKRRGEAEKT
jgi:hypothetical protein